ncbi:Protein kinase-like domain [Ceraceosorus bombacis]|uniref:Protein kinase-like domain n=1 Tax=Ceraceosorus bombacis TaxID=401625 RepID=A0A0P1BEX3_9BASI|nr:Protein kinase-like domain [Ceraceosorus bombacis]
MEVKRYISLETLAGIVALGSGGSKPPEVLGGSKASASARLLAQLVEYCMGTGARTGVIFSGAYLLVVDMDGTNKPRITVRTPSVAPACGPILETPSRSGNDLETRYNLPCTLLALMTHALERAERLGQRPILQKHVLDENSDADYKHVESSGSSQDRPSSRQLRSHTRRVRSRPTPRGSAQGLLDEAKSRPDVELRGLPIGGGACARVYRAYVLSGQIMPTSSGTTLLAKVYWLRGQSYQHYEDTFHPVALHEARIYRALEVLQGESVPHVVGILTRGAGTEQQLQQWCDDSTFAVTSAVTPRAPLPEADIDTPPLRASRGSDKDKASIKLCPTPPRQVLGLVLTDAGKTLAEMSYKDLIQLAQSVEADVEVSVGSMAAALKEAFLRSARSIHAAGVLHCDIRAANMCVAVEQGKLRCRFIDFHLATFADPQKDGKHFGNELQRVEEVVDDSLSNILSA